jgi:hypothetical protein
LNFSAIGQPSGLFAVRFSQLAASLLKQVMGVTVEGSPSPSSICHVGWGSADREGFARLPQARHPRPLRPPKSIQA